MDYVFTVTYYNIEFIYLFLGIRFDKQFCTRGNLIYFSNNFGTVMAKLASLVSIYTTSKGSCLPLVWYKSNA